MHRMAQRVFSGRLLVIATLLPTSAFIRVDLPTFGLPAKQANPDRNSGSPRAWPGAPAGPGPAEARTALSAWPGPEPDRAAAAPAGSAMAPDRDGFGCTPTGGSSSCAGPLTRSRRLRR